MRTNAFAQRWPSWESERLEGWGTALKVRAVIALKAEHRLEVVLDVAGLARSTFFYHQSRLQGPDPRASLKAAITEIFKKYRGRYGHRRIHLELLKQGWTVAMKTVLKLMRSLRLVCKVRSRKRYNSYQGEQGIVAPNCGRSKPEVGHRCDRVQRR